MGKDAADFQQLDVKPITAQAAELLKAPLNGIAN